MDLETMRELKGVHQEAIDQLATLVQMYYDGKLRFTHSEPRFHEMMESHVEWLEIEAGLKIDTKEIA